MKPQETRPDAHAHDAPSRKVTAPGIAPRPPTVDDDATVPRRQIELPAPSEPVVSQPLLGAALTASLGDTDPTGPRQGGFGDTVPEPARKEFPSASDLLAATPGPGEVKKDSGWGALAKATPVIPERADSDGARNARFATEGAPARAAKVTMPTGAVLVEPGDAEVVRGPEVDLDALASASPPRRVYQPTVPAGHVIEREERQAYFFETKKGITAGISVALSILALVMLGLIGWRHLTETPPAAPVAPVASALPAVSPHAPAPTVPVAVAPVKTAQVVSPVPPPVIPPVASAPSTHHGKPVHSSHASPPVPPVPPVQTTPAATAPGPVAPPVPTDISHSIH